MDSLLKFPDPVNEIAARLVAGVVVILTTLYLFTGNVLLLGFVVYGFVARAATGPTLSPVAQLVTRGIVPRLRIAERPTPGPPKRFAQGIGATLSLAALTLHLTAAPGASALMMLVLVAASLESFLGVCLGCTIFARLMKLGVIPDTVCDACANLSLRTGFTESGA